MATYLTLNAIVLLVLIVGLGAWRALHLSRAVVLVLLALVVTTAIFDTVMIHFELFAYSDSRTLGLLIGKAPVEDFAYAIAAGILIPSVWVKLGGEEHGKTTSID